MKFLLVTPLFWDVSNHVLFSVLRDSLQINFDKIRFLVKYHSGFQPAKPVNLRISGLNIYTHTYI